MSGWPDPRYCCRCDRPLPGPAPSDPGGQLRYCAACERDRQAYEEALGGFDAQRRSPDYRGTVALGTPLPGWPTDVTLLAMDVWDRFFELRTAEVPGPNPPDPHPRALGLSPRGQPPRQWIITTDTGSVHHGFPGGGHGGAKGVFHWRQTFAPSLAEDVRSIEVFAHAPGATSTTTVAITGWPARIVRPAVVVDDAAPPRRPGLPVVWAAT